MIQPTSQPRKTSSFTGEIIADVKEVQVVSPHFHPSLVPKNSPGHLNLNNPPTVVASGSYNKADISIVKDILRRGIKKLE